MFSFFKRNKSDKSSTTNSTSSKNSKNPQKLAIIDPLKQVKENEKIIDEKLNRLDDIDKELILCATQFKKETDPKKKNDYAAKLKNLAKEKEIIETMIAQPMKAITTIQNYQYLFFSVKKFGKFNIV